MLSFITRSLLTIVVFVGLFTLTHAAVGPWGQCGGQLYHGETTCVSGYTCAYGNPWYSQCQPGQGPPNPTTPSNPTTTSTPGGPTVNIPRSTFTEINNFGPNPNNVRVWVYVPAKLAANPPILAAIHWCSGTALQMYNTNVFNTLAEQKGFIVIFPEAPASTHCWDVNTDATLRHDAGGDSLGIVSAIRWAITNLNGNRSRVYATGISSGAMMTNVLMGAYPDVFAAGSAVAGVPYSCYQGPNAWNTACAMGQLVKTPQEWGNAVRSGYPGYTGARPKMQFWHGTNDNVLYYQNFLEETKQWTNVHGVSQTPTNTVQNYPYAGWTRYDYGPNVMAISAQGVGHDIAYPATQIMEWFGL